MPTYDYECRACGHRFEHWQQMTDKRLRRCPACGKPRLERLVGAGGGLIFKGSGFYVTDYKRKGGDGTSDPASGGGDAAKAKESSAPKDTTSAPKDTTPPPKTSPAAPSQGQGGSRKRGKA
jgi:putative FmdB family regulatory protein